jgi:hypothetical protein
MPLSISLFMQYEPRQQEDKEDPPILIAALGISHGLAVNRNRTISGAGPFRNEIDVARELPKIIAHKSLYAEVFAKPKSLTILPWTLT